LRASDCLTQSSHFFLLFDQYSFKACHRARLHFLILSGTVCFGGGAAAPDGLVICDGD